MITVNKIEPFKAEFFDPNGNSLGFLNEYEFIDVRIQIAKSKIEGYYFVFEDERINIERNGSIRRWPQGFYDQFDKGLSDLLAIMHPKNEV